MGEMASQITSLTIVYSIVHSGADQRKHQSSASLAFVRGIHRWPVNSPHKWPVTWKMFPFDDVIMIALDVSQINSSPPSAAYMRRWIGSGLVQVMACRLFGAKPLPQPMFAYCRLDFWEQISMKFESEFCYFHARKFNLETILSRRDELTNWSGNIMISTKLSSEKNKTNTLFNLQLLSFQYHAIITVYVFLRKFPFIYLKGVVRWISKQLHFLILHICPSQLRHCIYVCSNGGLSPVRHQAITSI